jgi:hypothetical protein
MKKISVMVKQVLMSTLTAGTFAFAMAFGFTSCTDETDSMSDNNNTQAPEGAKTELLEAYGLTFQNFINADDVVILDADTTKLSISKAYADKMGITSFVNHPMGIWQKMGCVPYIRKATGEELVGDRFIVDVVPATVAEVVGDKSVNLQTNIYVNNDASAVKTRAAGNNIPEYAAKYIDENDVIHPAAVLMTDPYGYDEDVHFSDDQPSVAQTRAAQSGEFECMTAEEIVRSQTRWSTNLRLLEVKTEFDKTVHFAAKGKKDSLEVEVKTGIGFGLNYFLTLEGGIKWNWCIPSPYVKKFETGVDGHFDLDAEVMFRFKKEFDLEDKLKCELAKFPGYTFTFFVGPIPVAISITPSMFIKMDGKVSGCVETGFTYKYGNKFKGGFSYVDGKLSAIKGFEETANKFDIIPAQACFNLETGVGLYLGADILIYKAAGPEFAVGPRLGGKLKLEGIPFKAPKEVADLYNVEGMVNLTINAVAGAKLKLLGYEVAETSVTIPLLGDDEDGWVLFKYPFDPEKDEAVHQSPAEKLEAERLNNLKPKFQEVMDQLMQKNAEVYAEYEYVIGLIMELNGMTREQAEDELMKQLLKVMPNFENYEGMTTKMATTKMYLTKIGQQLYNKREGIVAEQSWKSVEQTLKECPAYSKYVSYFADYYNLKMDLNLVRAEFKENHGREAAMTQGDIEALVGYMQSFARLYCQNNADFMKQFDSTIVPSLINFGSKSLSEKDRERIAYETLLQLRKVYRNLNFTKVNWNESSASSLAGIIRWQYNNCQDRVINYGK